MARHIRPRQNIKTNATPPHCYSKKPEGKVPAIAKQQLPVRHVVTTLAEDGLDKLRVHIFTDFCDLSVFQPEHNAIEIVVVKPVLGF